MTFSDGECTLRTQEAYMKQVALVERHPQLRTVYGIKGNSPFSSLEYFSPIWGFPSDLAHDLFEGFVSEALEHMIL